MAGRNKEPSKAREAVRKARGWGLFFAQFFRLAGPYWSSERKWKVRWLTLALTLLTVGQVMIPVAMNIWNERLFDSLERRSIDEFTMLVVVVVLIMVANAAITTVHLKVRRRLQVDWREWLTARTLDKWMAAGHQHQVAYLPGEHDNPDGRIAEDIRISTESAIELAHSLFFCILLLGSFTKILWDLSGSPYVRIGEMELFIPGHLVWIAVLYSVVGASVAWALGHPLVAITNRRQGYEADFRFGLVHARENALPIALLRGEEQERRGLLGLFRGVTLGWDAQTNALFRLYLFLASWPTFSQVFPILIMAPRYIAGTITLGVLMKTAQAFQQMVGALSWPIDNLANATAWRASVERVMGLREALDELEKRAVPSDRDLIRIEKGDAPVLAFHDLIVTSPTGELLIWQFGATIGPGDRVLISGDIDAAFKLCKVLAGLWPWGRGLVQLPADAPIFFVPQRPYLPIGTLRDAVTYPGVPGSLRYAEVAAALKRVGLERMVIRLGESEKWEEVLSVDEQVRLGFARLLLHKPRWIVIQEAADALETQGVEDMMAMLQENEFRFATVITVGHRSVLDAYHRRKLVLVRADGHVIVQQQAIESETENGEFVPIERQEPDIDDGETGEIWFNRRP